MALAYLGFAKEFMKQVTMPGLAARAHNSYKAAKASSEEIVADMQAKGISIIDSHKKIYGDKYGLPTADSSPEEKARYASFISKSGKTTAQEFIKFRNQMESRMGDEGKNYLISSYSKDPSWVNSVGTDGIAEAVNMGWGETAPPPAGGIMDIFNKTADARATALGITRFRGTDGAMGTLGSIGSLLYKDDSSFSNNVMIAGALGGAAVAGVVAGKAIGAGLDATLTDRD